jgi:hypothetical protein
VEELQSLREALVRGEDECVVVVARQDVVERVDLEWAEAEDESVEKVVAVIGPEEEVAGVASVRGDVVDASVEVPQSARHRSRIGSVVDRLDTTCASRSSSDTDTR